MEELLPEIQGTEKPSPERALLCEVILLAIVDSLGKARTRTNGTTIEEAAERARAWLQRSPVCRHYCALVDIDHQAMLDRLARHWQ